MESQRNIPTAPGSKVASLSSIAAGCQGDRPAIADHEVLRLIGAGSYGQVWLVRSVTGQFRAAKIIRRSSFHDQHPYDREFDGIRAFEPLSRGHPHLVHILHVGIDKAGGYFYYIMELADDDAEGKDFDPATYSPRTLELFARGSRLLPLPACATVGRKLADAIDFLHRHGRIHRDVKPSNIIFVHGEPKLADIGLVTTEGRTLTLLGTPGYMPPEGTNSRAADVYALGKVLYELCTGKHHAEFPALPAESGNRSDAALLAEFNSLWLRTCGDAGRHRATAADVARRLSAIESGASGTRPDARRRIVAAVAFALLAAAAGLSVLVQRTGPGEARRPLRDPGAAPGLPPVAPPGGQPAANKAVVDPSNPAGIEMRTLRRQRLEQDDSRRNWTFVRVPPEFEGAWIYAGQGDGWADFKVIRTGRLYVACNYTYQGNPDGGWLGGVWRPEDFIKHGWAPVAGLRLVGWNDREHQFFSRWCEQGETFRFRCNKYESPYVIHF